MLRAFFALLLVIALAAGVGMWDGVMAGPGRTITATIVQGDEPDSLDPGISTLTITFNVFVQMFDPIVFRDGDGTIKPWVAESWQLVTPTQLRLKIRQGIRFHDGSALTAHDVRYSIERIRDPATRSRARSWIPLQITTIEAPDDGTVLINLSEPHAPLLARLSNIYVVPASLVTQIGNDEFARRPIGSGPYRFVEWIRGQQVVVDAFDRYWKGRPQVDRLVFKAVSEATVRAAELLAGRADVIAQFPPALAKRASSQWRIETVTSVRRAFVTITPKPPFDDVKVRRAINHALNKKALVDQVLQGYGEVLNGLITPDEVGYDPNVGGYAYDPGRAKQLLAEANFKPGTKVAFQYPVGRYPADKELSEAIAIQLRDVGLDLQLEPVDPQRFVQILIAQRGVKQLGFAAQGNFLADPDWVLANFFDSKRRGLYFMTPELDALIQEQLTQTDPKKRAAKLRQINRYLIVQAAVGFLLVYKDVYGVSNRLVWKPRGDELMLFWDAKLR